MSRVCGPVAESHALGPGWQACLAHFHPSPLSHAPAPCPQVFLLLQSGMHTILPHALLSWPGLTIWDRRNHPDAGEMLCSGRVCRPQDHHLGVKVPHERTGALPLQSRLRGSVSQLGQDVSTPASSTLPIAV